MSDFKDYGEMENFLKNESTLPEKVFTCCLNLAYEDAHSGGVDCIIQKFQDLETIFAEVYTIGYTAGCNFSSLQKENS